MAGKGSSPWKYKKKYCEMLIDHMRQGLSYESFAGLVGVSRQCLYQWEDRYADFKKAKEVGKSGSLKTWEQIGLGLATGKLKGSAASYIFTMKNRFNWSDKTETTLKTNDEGLTLNYNLNDTNSK